MNAIAKNKTAPRPLLPRLRFAGFRGEWGYQPLAELATRSTRKNARCEINRVLTNSAEHGVVDQRDFFDKDIANPKNLEGYYIVEKGAYVYNPRISNAAPVGPVSKNNIATGIMSPLYTVFQFHGNGDEFYAHYFKTTHWHQYMRESSSTGARHDRMSISNDAFMNLPLPVSTPAEQQKIAACLSSLDTLITAQTQKLDTLKTHKKGLMQQLFPRAGETTPRLRFAEFRDAGEWEAQTLKEISEPVEERVGDRSLTPISISAGIGFVPQAEKFGRDISGNQYKLYTVIRDGDFVYNKGNSLKFPQGCVYDLQGWGEAAAPNVFICFRLKTGYENAFYRQCFERNLHGIQLRKQITSGARSNGLLNISKEVFYGISIPTPQLEEQQKIAACLSSLDELITAQAQKVAALQTHKKGLMQQLFPVQSEASA